VTPDSHAVRKALPARGSDRRAGMLLLSARPHAALAHVRGSAPGANGIGICPSGMLAPKPEIISFLRGLHGEVQGLEPVLTGSVPKDSTKADHAEVTVWNARMQDALSDRHAGSTPVSAKDGRVTFQLPVSAKSAHVMLRADRCRLRRALQRRVRGPMWCMSIVWNHDVLRGARSNVRERTSLAGSVRPGTSMERLLPAAVRLVEEVDAPVQGVHNVAAEQIAAACDARPSRTPACRTRFRNG